MTFEDFKQLIEKDKRPVNWTKGELFYFELLKVKPNIANVYIGTQLDPRPMTEVNPLIWGMTLAVWDDN